MAILLKEQYELLALIASMEISGAAVRVRFALEASQDHQRRQLGEWKVSAEELGIPPRLEQSAARYQGLPFRLPGALVAALAELLGEHAAANDALWLHLAKPSGYLPLVPWEQLLNQALQRPILRLPDFLVDPFDSTPGTLDVALCSSEPEAKAAFMAGELLVRLAQVIQRAATQPVTIHIFTDAGTFPELKRTLAEAGLRESAVRLYDPSEAAAYALPPATVDVTEGREQLVSPWLLWMRQALRKRSVDIVHFLAHGYMQQDVGALALAQSPSVNEDTTVARFVGANELRSFLTQVGAWGCSMTSPQGNYSEMGLRLFASMLAAVRPGPLLHHELRLDANLDAVALAYRFLLAGRPATPPASPALAIYCHPARVLAGEGVLEAAPAAAFAPMPVAKDIAHQSGREPNWYGATMRYFDIRALDLARQKSVTEASPQSASREEAIDVSDTVRQLQKIVEETAAEAATAEAASTTAEINTSTSGDEGGETQP